MYTVGILYGVALGVLSAMIGGIWGVGVAVLGILGTAGLLYLELHQKGKKI